MHRLLPNRSNWCLEARISDGPNCHADKSGVLARLRIDGRTTVGAEERLEDVALGGRPLEPFGLAYDRDQVCWVVRENAEG